VLTGSYHNYFRIYDADTLNDVVLQADKSAFKAKKIGGPLPGAKGGLKNGRGLREAMQLDTLDFNKKILHASWHPRENTIAVCVFRSELLARRNAHSQAPDRRHEQPLPVQCRIINQLSTILLCHRRLSLPPNLLHCTPLTRTQRVRVLRMLMNQCPNPTPLSSWFLFDLPCH